MGAATISVSSHVRRFFKKSPVLEIKYRLIQLGKQNCGSGDSQNATTKQPESGLKPKGVGDMQEAGCLCLSP